jgi:orotidine-5'-phosphate decarboxylase
MEENRMALDRLIEGIVKLQNPTVAGLDPKLDYIPDYIKEKAFEQHGETLEGAAAALLEFNKGLIDALCGIVPAIKPQCAYYEMYGWQGVKALRDTISYAKEKGIFVITDGKRNDIGSTAEAYSAAFLGATATEDGSESALDVDALTVNPYLGIDGILPFLKDCKVNGKGIFVLVKTSNPSAGELQDLKLESGRTVYEHVASLVHEWGKEIVGESGYSSVGAVAGATYPAEAERIREIMPRGILLVPGYGAQGGAADDCAASFNLDGLGAIVNASRSIMCAYKSPRWSETFDETAFAEAARAEAFRMRDDLNDALERRFG